MQVLSAEGERARVTARVSCREISQAGHTADTRRLKSMRHLRRVGTIYGLLCSSTRGWRQRELLNLGCTVGDTCCQRGEGVVRPPALFPEGRIVYMVLSLVV